MMFGRYRVLGELGRGAIGTVHRALDPLIEREVAVKALNPNLPDDIASEVRVRFLREAKSAGRLNHANIVQIYDVGEQNGVAYIAMELLEGRTLQDMLRDPEKMPFQKCADLAAQVADGLDHAHYFSIVHRDVKPANIMVSPSGRAKLTDFGVAYIPSSSVTHAGQALGSPKYMSPEQVLGLPIDPRSDIFSLGVVFYEMLTRRTPFEQPGDTNIYPLLHRIAGEPHVPASELDRSVPKVFDVILNRALAKKPGDRYQRVSEMAKDLRKVLETFAAGAVASEETIPAGRAPWRPDPTVLSRTTTIAIPVPPRPAPNEKSHEQLLADLDQFAKTFEQTERERVQAEEAARLAKQAELERWSKEQAKQRDEFDRQREMLAKGGETAMRAGAAMELMRKRSTQKPVGDKVAKTDRAEALQRMDERLRASFHYLSEFAREMNTAHPESERPYALPYLTEAQNAVLSDGFTDYRTAEVDGKPRFDHVTFRFKVTSGQPVSIDLQGPEIERFRERLTALGIKYKYSGRMGDLSGGSHATFSVSGPFPCKATVRADYNDFLFFVELENVRRQGLYRAQISLDDFTHDVLDEFGTYVLGADDAFERRLAAGS
ncbi:MAG TPA: protein kinase [Burkholderiales bacterium]|nr:protein kinase [Burkholderiales bacterium]